jgi:hypothetical protein
MIHALNGVEVDFLPDGGSPSIPLANRRVFGRSFPAPIINLWTEQRAMFAKAANQQPQPDHN